MDTVHVHLKKELEKGLVRGEEKMLFFSYITGSHTYCIKNIYIYIYIFVVQFCFWFNLDFPLFFPMLIYDNEYQTKENPN